MKYDTDLIPVKPQVQQFTMDSLKGIKRETQNYLIKAELHLEVDFKSKKGVSDIYLIKFCQTKEMIDVKYLKYA